MHIMVFITAPSPEEAENIASVLIESKLAACVNIIPGVRSVFAWKGKKESSEEHLLIAKTTSRAFKKLENTVKDLHSYDTPEIISIPLSESSREYLDWIDEAVSI